jgi:hypothetical protein
MRLAGWNSAHRAFYMRQWEALLKDSSQIMALRRDVAASFGVLPLYGDIGGYLVLFADGEIGCVEFEADGDKLVDEFVGSADRQEWFEFAWNQSRQKYPDLLGSLDYEFHAEG